MVQLQPVVGWFLKEHTGEELFISWLVGKQRKRKVLGFHHPLLGHTPVDYKSLLPRCFPGFQHCVRPRGTVSQSAAKTESVLTFTVAKRSKPGFIAAGFTSLPVCYLFHSGYMVSFPYTNYSWVIFVLALCMETIL